MFLILAAILAVFMLACGYAGYAKRFGLFALVLLTGLALNSAWMIFGLNAHPLEPSALMAHMAAVMYALAALGTGWLTGRMVRAFRESRVDP